MFRNRKYILDHSDLQYKLVRLPLKQKFLRFLMWFGLSVAVSAGYFIMYDWQFGSPKVKLLERQVDELRLRYSLLDRKLNESYKSVAYLQQSDEMIYRPILKMDTIPESFRHPGYGGVDRFREFKGLENSDLIISLREKLENIKNLASIQEESFNSISERTEEWIDEFEHVPWICPVDVSIPRGDGIKFRQEHPVLGYGRWHFGQDFSCPYGTKVYATGDGKVSTAGWTSNGFGSHIIIDHGYGFVSIYGHLSRIDVSVGMNVKRGDLIGYSGSSGTSSGPHLHYQVDRYGEHQNPLHFFTDDLTSEEYLSMITHLSSKSKFR